MGDEKQLTNFKFIQSEIKENYILHLHSYSENYGDDNAEIIIKLSEDNFITIMFLDGFIYIYRYGYELMKKTNSVDLAMNTIHDFITEKFH